MRMDENELVKGLRRGDLVAQKQAWIQFHDSILQAICSSARLRGGWNASTRKWEVDLADAQDILADTFFQFFRDASKFKGKSKISTWLYRIAMNRTVDFYRREARQVLAVAGQAANQPSFSDDEANLDDNQGQPSFGVEIIEEQVEPKKKPRVSRERKALALQVAASWHSRNEDPAEVPDLEAGGPRVELGLLTGRQAQVVGLRGIEGKSVRETAEILDISEGAVKMAYRRGLEILREQGGRETPAEDVEGILR